MNVDLRDQWLTEGSVLIRHVFDRKRTARLLLMCDAILEQWRIANPETGKPGGGPDATVMRHLNHAGYFHAHPEWLGELMDAVADETVLEIVRTILDDEPLFRCTSYFFNPTLTSLDGNWHRDSQFVTPNDEAEQEMLLSSPRAGSGVQMQIALVPSDDVEYVPSSHRRWDTPAEYHIRKAEEGKHSRSHDMPGAVRLALEPGDAALFNPMGLHRGRYHADRLRRTLMLTYTRASVPCYDYFSHQPWFLEPGYLDRLSPRARPFFERFVEMYAQRWREKLAETAAASSGN